MKQLNDVQSLGAMLRYRRPAGSRTEKAFIKKHLLPLGMNIDKYGNLYKKIGDSPVLWSCHTDTVHKTGGKQNIIHSDGKFKVFDPDSNCLGADDTAGVWLMAQMIEAKVPGFYVFHRAEEVGGKGSDHFVKHNKELLKGVEYAIAFDRAGKNSIITHQMSQRCCSEDFSKALAKEIGMQHSSDRWGSFTDTANYTDDVGECTNLSVGYKHQHQSTEELDTNYLFELRDALFDFNYKNLTSKRKAGEVEWKYSNYGAYGGWDGSEFWEDYYYRDPQTEYMRIENGLYHKGRDGVYRKITEKTVKDDELSGYINRNGVLIPVNKSGDELFNHKAIPVKKSGNSTVGSNDDSAAENGGAVEGNGQGNFPLDEAPTIGSNSIHGGFERLVQLIKDNPREVADFFEESGVTPDELGYAIYQRGGYLRTSSISSWRGHTLKGNK